MTSPILVDSHCHIDKLNYEKFHQNIDEVLDKAKANDVQYLLTVGVTLDLFPNMLAMAEPYENVFTSVGIHPSDISQQDDFTQLETYARLPKVIAIGETGLDYFHQTDNKDAQQKSFSAHIDLAKRLNKPLIVHTRSAKEDTFSVLKHENAKTVGGVIHCFTEDWEMAKRFLDLGFYISISGIVTFKKALELQEVARKIPLDRLLVETDSPFLSPEPVRGKENQPAHVKHIAQFIADLRGENYLQIAEQTTKNFFELFKAPIAKFREI